MTKNTKLKPGDKHYRHYVGHGNVYDKAGASQFNLLCTLGLREYHRVLDVGCGSLRLGRLLIPWLEADNYQAIEPNQWLIEEGLKHHFGYQKSEFNNIVNEKRPFFSHSTEFDACAPIDYFDYMIAHSIFTHCGLDLVQDAMAKLIGYLHPNGIFIATFKMAMLSTPGNDWLYPEVSYIRQNDIDIMCNSLGIHWIALPWLFPVKQQWILFTKDPTNIPSGNWIHWNCQGKTFKKPKRENNSEAEASE